MENQNTGKKQERLQEQTSVLECDHVKNGRCSTTTNQFGFISQASSPTLCLRGQSYTWEIRYYERNRFVLVATNEICKIILRKSK